MISKRSRVNEIANYQISLNNNTRNLIYFRGTSSSNNAIVAPSPAVPADANAWTHLAVTVASTSGVAGTCAFYKNGVQVATATGCGLPSNSHPFWIGGQDQENDEPVRGDLDEVRVSAGVRPAAWLKAEHANQRAGSTFLTVTQE
jgi:hypothetical protein